LWISAKSGSVNELTGPGRRTRGRLAVLPESFAKNLNSGGSDRLGWGEERLRAICVEEPREVSRISKTIWPMLNLIADRSSFWGRQKNSEPERACRGKTEVTPKD